ncbi:MAG: hypothetical protein ACI837_001605 [Crocinitomicaceae bacterium]|jgi:hypothetical protein
MKYLVTFILLTCMILPSMAQDSFTTISNVELHDLGDGQATLKMSIKSNEISKLNNLKIQITGSRIPRGTLVMTLKGGPTIMNRDQSQNFEFEGNLTLTAVNEEKENGLTYEIKEDALNKFRKLKPGSVLYFPPIVKAE